MASITMSVTAHRAVRGGTAGNFTDQFDIFLPVIALAPVTGELYGPGTAATWAGLVFVATLVGRPVGAAVFGHLADRWGRSATTQLTVAGVAVTTALIGCVPDHTVLGQGTLLAILALRLLGGIFIGGEYTAAIPLAMEWAQPRRRGLISGVIMAMSPLANATIAAITLLLLEVLGPHSYARWGWRVVFWIGAALALSMVVYYRRRVEDVPVEQQAVHRHNPVRDVVAGAHRRTLWRVFVLMSGLWLFTYLAIPILTSQLALTGHNSTEVTTIMLVATATSVPSMIFAGHLSTLMGRRRFLMLLGAVAVVTAPSCYLLAVGSSHVTAAAVAAALLQVTTVSAYGPIGAYLCEMFPRGVRASGYGIGYSLAMVLPALYPFYLPALQGLAGPRLAVIGMFTLAACLLFAAAAWADEPYRDQAIA